MKRSRSLGLTLLVASLVGMATTQASASERRGYSERYTEYAPVIRVEPVYREVSYRQPRQECWIEREKVIVGYETTHYRHNRNSTRRSYDNSAGNVVAGTVIGGVIGNQISRGSSHSSRAGATVVGAILGAAIASESGGRQVSRHRRHSAPVRKQSRPIYETREVKRCKRVVESHRKQRIQHYKVTYRHKGREYVTRSDRHPGARIKLQVSINPSRRR